MKVTDFFDDPDIVELIDAGLRGDASRVKNLVNAGTDINAVGKKDMTPLMWALGKQNKRGLRTLLKNGADPNYVAPVNGWSTVTMSAGAEDPEFLDIILTNGGDPNLCRKRQPALFLAVSNRREQNIRRLVEAGADLNQTDPLGQTALILAGSLNHFEQAALLLQLGADHEIESKTGGSIASRVETSRVKPGTPHYDWKMKVRSMLQERGVSFPVTPPWEKHQKG